jgi:hypothetical protein
MRARHVHALAAALAFVLIAGAAAAATLTIVNQDGPGEGFNDPTAVAPVGGNPGTTVGAQRLFVFQYAANIWGSLLSDNITVFIDSRFDPLSCTATSGVLGSAGPVAVDRDFPGAPFGGTWYNGALANKLANADLDPGSDDIDATFNSSVGTPTCLSQGWYYGVDGNEGSQIELLPVVLHELGHGLGFLTLTDESNGTEFMGLPSVWDHFLFDNTQALHWNQMSDAQRMASAINCSKLVWDGASVTNRAPIYLGPKPLLHVNAPGGIAGDYPVGVATFGPTLTSGGVTGNVVLVNDGVGTTSDACETPFVNAGAIAGNIALVDRGTCAFSAKVKNCQNAGAIGVIVADNVAGCPPVGMSGVDATITIPSVRVTQADGATLKANLGAGLNVTLHSNPAQLAGADATGKVLLFTPNPVQPGSSVSHWDTSCEPSLLMEPALTPGLSSNTDLTTALFADIGWFPYTMAVGNDPATGTHLGVSFPNPAGSLTTIQYSLARGEPVELSIYDLSGRLVNRLVSGNEPAGSHSVPWNGHDLAGQRVPSGVYLYRLRTPTFTETRRIAFVR